jgi:hypothetical protein
MTKAVRDDGIDNDCDGVVDEEECYPGLLQGTYRHYVLKSIN